MQCFGGKSLFFLPNVVNFFSNRRCTCPISWHNIRHFEGNWCGLYHTLCTLRRWFVPIYPLFRLPLGLECVVVRRSKSSSGFRLINAKHSVEVNRRFWWPIVSKRNTLRIVSSYRKDFSQSKPLIHLICLWLTRYRKLSIADRRTACREFLIFFGCSDLNWRPERLTPLLI